MVRISSMISTVLPTPGAAEHRGLAAARDRRQQVDHLDAGLEHFARAGLPASAGAGRWIGQRGMSAGKRRAAIDRVAERIQDPPEDRLADRHAERLAQAPDRRAAAEPGGALQRDRAHAEGIEVALDLDGQAPRADPTAISSASLIAGSSPFGNATSITEPRTAITRACTVGSSGWPT